MPHPRPACVRPGSQRSIRRRLGCRSSITYLPGRLTACARTRHTTPRDRRAVQPESEPPSTGEVAAHSPHHTHQWGPAGAGPHWSTGRGGGIRTPDPLLPKQVRYQTALRPESKHKLIYHAFITSSTKKGIDDQPIFDAISSLPVPSRSQHTQYNGDGYENKQNQSGRPRQSDV